ncbi:MULTISPECIES: hypothetical protein [Mycobacteroides]|uniref:hypothetical protein n=1 Tax=Mycobacteroides TaxID=670516 RepID=UPI0008AA24E0|nr:MULTISPECIES: hypothetical protein [Mycobacteroides]MBN7512267.1 hypothetical protein [Mycobacteroides abscessus subsp. massiliense]OHU29582.1 hypothetical protein BKG74_03365 [Mycobacteroides chelonae]SLF13660.1 Uncharacterised protein [Mycobacteroides abscessus subsp. massiliense]
MKMHPGDLGDCPAIFPILGDTGCDFLCTREDGHDGSHMAAGIAEVLAIWDAELAWCEHRNGGEKWFGNTGREWVEVAE